jgi:hypothetical protein
VDIKLKDNTMTDTQRETMQIDFDADMDRFYIPVNSRYEIQTKGKGSSFRIANTLTHERWLIGEERLHPMLEELARTTNAELRQASAQVAQDKITALEARNRELESALDICHDYGCLHKDYIESKTYLIVKQALLSTQPTDALDKKEVK